MSIRNRYLCSTIVIILAVLCALFAFFASMLVDYIPNEFTVLFRWALFAAIGALAYQLRKRQRFSLLVRAKVNILTILELGALLYVIGSIAISILYQIYPSCVGLLCGPGVLDMYERIGLILVAPPVIVAYIIAVVAKPAVDNNEGRQL